MNMIVMIVMIVISIIVISIINTEWLFNVPNDSEPEQSFEGHAMRWRRAERRQCNCSGCALSLLRHGASWGWCLLTQRTAKSSGRGQYLSPGSTASEKPPRSTSLGSPKCCERRSAVRTCVRACGRLCGADVGVLESCR